MERLRGFAGQIWSGDIQALLTRYSDLLLAGGIMWIIGMILIPMSPFILDILLTANVTIAVVILMVSIYVQEPSRFASFPSILLITTLFRLGLNISTSRLILLKGDAGEVVRTFGAFVAGGDLVVGVTIFFIITIVMFIVITKGAERVAEVAARFTLDALPGKQMSIDADLRSGILELEEARRRRGELQRESQLYGAMDGAMKFVKGDAVAGLLIVFVNIGVGLAMGVFRHGMDVGRALRTYSILTIGDGLVSQLPALMICVAAGVIVTRVATDEKESHLGQDIMGQVLAQPKALAIVSVLLFLLGLIKGLPKAPFFLLSVAMGLLAFLLYRTRKEKQRAAEAAAEVAASGASSLALAIPVLVDVSASITAVIDRQQEGGQTLSRLVPELRDSLYLRLGVLFPPIQIRGGQPMPEGTFRILLKEVPVHQGLIPPGMTLVEEPPEGLAVFRIEGTEAPNPATGKRASWVAEASAETLRQAGLPVRTPAEVLLLHLSRVLMRHADEFLGLQEVQTMLDQLGSVYPKLVDEVVPRVVGLRQLTEVLQRLVREGISIRDLKGIMESLSEWGRIESDPLPLSELVRVSMARQISFAHARPDGRLIVYQIDPEIERAITESIRQTPTGRYIGLSPDMQADILSAIRAQLGSRPDTTGPPVVITEPEVRPYLRRLVAIEFPDCAVLSMRELTTELLPQPIGMIALGTGA